MADYENVSIGDDMPVCVGDKVWRVLENGNPVMFRIDAVLELDALFEVWLMDCDGYRHPPAECFAELRDAINYFIRLRESRVEAIDAEKLRIREAVSRAATRLKP